MIYSSNPPQCRYIRIEDRVHDDADANILDGCQDFSRQGKSKTKVAVACLTCLSSDCMTSGTILMENIIHAVSGFVSIPVIRSQVHIPNES